MSRPVFQFVSACPRKNEGGEKDQILRNIPWSSGNSLSDRSNKKSQIFVSGMSTGGRIDAKGMAGADDAFGKAGFRAKHSLNQ